MQTTTDVVTEIVTITPEMASRMLDMNLKNRKVRTAIVNRYARDMQTGNWKMNGEAIKVGSDGSLLDGQHRLLACQISGASFSTLLVRGLNFEVRETMDMGARRTMADVLRWREEVSAPSLAAALETAMAWEKNGVPSHKGVSHTASERLAYLDANPDIREAVRAAHGLVKVPLKIPMSVGGAFVYRAFRLAPAETEVFLHLLKTGANIGENHPVNRLRNWAFSALNAKGTRHRDEYAAVMVKAWNAWIDGREIRHLSWRNSGDRAEEFPVMHGPDGRTYDEWLADPASRPAAQGIVSE